MDAIYNFFGYTTSTTPTTIISDENVCNAQQLNNIVSLQNTTNSTDVPPQQVPLTLSIEPTVQEDLTILAPPPPPLPPSPLTPPPPPPPPLQLQCDTAISDLQKPVLMREEIPSLNHHHHQLITYDDVLNELKIKIAPKNENINHKETGNLEHTKEIVQQERKVRKPIVIQIPTYSLIDSSSSGSVSTSTSTSASNTNELQLLKKQVCTLKEENTRLERNYRHAQLLLQQFKDKYERRAQRFTRVRTEMDKALTLKDNEVRKTLTELKVQRKNNRKHSQKNLRLKHINEIKDTDVMHDESADD